MRDITVMGITITVGFVMLVTGVWVATKLAGKRVKPEGIVEEKIVVHYIKTGEVGGAFTHPPPNRVRLNESRCFEGTSSKLKCIAAIISRHCPPRTSLYEM